MLDNLNQRQRMFVYHYFKGLSITRSAIEAGYSSKPECAAVIGCRLLKNVKVRSALGTLNEQAGITPSRVMSNLVSVFNQKNNSVKTKASDIIKISNLFFKIWGLDLSKSGTRKPTRNKRRTGVGGISYSFDNFIKPNGDTYYKERLVESSVKEVVQTGQSYEPGSQLPEDYTPGVLSHEDNHLKVERAVPKKYFPKAVPTPAKVKDPVPAYSFSSFGKQDEISQVRVTYPA